MERSLQQAKLQRQDKTQDDAEGTDNTRHPSRSPDTTRQPTRSPDTSKQSSHSPNTSKQLSHSPDTSKHPSPSPDATKHSSHSPDTTSRSSNTTSPQSREHSGSNDVELKPVPGKGGASVKSKKYSKPAPIETNLDDPYLPESDTVALIDKCEDDIVPLQLAVEEETVILSSDEESTLLEK